MQSQISVTVPSLHNKALIEARKKTDIGRGVGRAVGRVKGRACGGELL